MSQPNLRISPPEVSVLNASLGARRSVIQGASATRWKMCPSLAAPPGPYSAHGQKARLAERQGPRAPDAFEGGARAARADRARAGKAAQPRHRQGNRGNRVGDGAECARGYAEAQR